MTEFLSNMEEVALLADEQSRNAEVRSVAVKKRKQVQREGEEGRQDATVGLVTHGDEEGEPRRKRRKATAPSGLDFANKENEIAELSRDAAEWAKRAEEEREEDREFRTIQFHTMHEILNELRTMREERKGPEGLRESLRGPLIELSQPLQPRGDSNLESS